MKNCYDIWNRILTGDISLCVKTSKQLKWKITGKMLEFQYVNRWMFWKKIDAILRSTHAFIWKCLDIWVLLTGNQNGWWTKYMLLWEILYICSLWITTEKLWTLDMISRISYKLKHSMIFHFLLFVRCMFGFVF